MVQKACELIAHFIGRIDRRVRRNFRFFSAVPRPIILQPGINILPCERLGRGLAQQTFRSDAHGLERPCRRGAGRDSWWNASAEREACVIAWRALRCKRSACRVSGCVHADSCAYAAGAELRGDTLPQLGYGRMAISASWGARRQTLPDPQGLLPGPRRLPPAARGSHRCRPRPLGES